MATIETLRLVIDARGAVTGSRQASEGLKGVQNQARTTDRGIRELDGRMERLRRTGGQLRQTLTTLFGVIGAGIAIRRGIAIIAGFERAMATLGGVTRATTIELEQLEEAARRMGAQTRFSAREAADGLLFLARAGFTVDDAINALPPVLNLAEAGLLGLGEAADIASNVLSQFGIEAENTARVSDVLVGVSNRTNTNVRQLAQALSFVGPQAASLGISLEETAAALGVLGDRGLQATRAGTALRAVLNELAPALDQSNPDRIGLVEGLRALDAANLDVTESISLFGQRFSVAGGILTDSTDKIEDVGRQIDFTGESLAQSAKQADTLEGAWRSLISATEEVVLQTGDAGVAGALRDVVDVLGDAVRVLGGAQPKLLENAQAAEILARALTGISVAAGASLVFRITGLTAALGALTGPLGVVLSLVPLVGGALVALSTDFDVANDAFGRTAKSLEDVEKRLQRIRAARDLALQGGRVGDLVRTQRAERRAVGTAAEDLLFQARRGEAGRVEVQDLARLFGDAISAAEIVARIDPADLDTGRALEQARRQGITLGPGLAEEIASQFPGALTTTPEAAARALEQLIPRLEALQFERLGQEIATQLALSLSTGLLGAGRAVGEAPAQTNQALQDLIGRAQGGGRGPVGETPRLDEFDQFIAALEEEVALAGLANDAREKRIALFEAEAILGRQLSDTERERVTDLVDGSQRAAEALQRRLDKERELEEQLRRQREEQRRLLEEQKRAFEEQQRRLEFVGVQVGTAFTRAFEDAVLSANSLRDVLRSLADDLARIAIRSTLGAALQGGLGSLFAGLAGGGGALGGGFGGPGTIFTRNPGNVQPFQHGGLITEPIMFPMRDGRVGRAGEVPEVILPVSKLRELSGGGGVTINNHFHGPTDAAGVRRSVPQVVAQLQRATRQARRGP